MTEEGKRPRVHIVRSNNGGEERLHAAFSSREAAQAYADGLGPGRNARVIELPLDLDPDPADDWRTIVDLDRDGAPREVQTRILESAGVTNAFFHGNVRPRAGRAGMTYRNIVLRLETDTLDQDEALREAREAWEKATGAGMWPPEGTDPRGMGEASDALWELTKLPEREG